MWINTDFAGNLLLDSALNVSYGAATACQAVGFSELPK